MENLPRYEPPGAGCSGDRVLAVRNTVGRAVEAWKGHGFLYHSRFRYCDRVRIHRHAIDAFKVGACRLTATQVAEMSLDLSADSLDTEEAPIPAMIQRLGRLNRFGEQTGRWSVCPVKEPLPYTMDELEQTRRWLNVLRGYGSRLSQSDLVRAWEESGHADEDCQPLEVMTDPLIVRPELRIGKTERRSRCCWNQTSRGFPMYGGREGSTSKPTKCRSPFVVKSWAGSGSMRRGLRRRRRLVTIL